MYNHHDPFEELGEAMHNLWVEIVKALKLQEIVEWLNKKLSK